MAVTTPATTTASWGVTGSAGVSGIVTDLEVGGEPVLAPEYNEKGAVVKQTMYDTKKTATATIEVDASTQPPTPGAAITVGTLGGYVTSARLVESNQAYRKIVVTIEAYAGCATTTAP